MGAMASKPFLPAGEDRQGGTRGDTLSLVSKTATTQKLTLEISDGQKIEHRGNCDIF
jgi:hypothetical protein